jgi:hypothetical protein
VNAGEIAESVDQIIDTIPASESEEESDDDEEEEDSEPAKDEPLPPPPDSIKAGRGHRGGR